MATFKGNEFFCYDLSHNPIQSSTDEITLAFRTLQRNGLMLHTHSRKALLWNPSDRFRKLSLYDPPFYGVY